MAYVKYLRKINGEVAQGEATIEDFDGVFKLDNTTPGRSYNPLVQTGAIALSEGPNAQVGAVDTVKITANGSAITVPGAWVNVGTDSITITNGTVNRIMVCKLVDEIQYKVKVN